MSQATRRRLLRRARDEIAQRSAPRVEMALLLVVSGLAALLASYWLLRFGLFSMALRYPLAATVGYLAFIVVLRVWVRLRHDDISDEADDLVELSELAPSSLGPRIGGPKLSSDVGSDGSSSSGWDLDDLVFIAVLIAMVVGLAVVLCFVLVEAPALFAEAIVDTAIVTGLYKSLGPVAETFWIERVVSHTWKSFLLIAVLCTIMGWAAQNLAPEQATLGGVIDQLTDE